MVRKAASGMWRNPGEWNTEKRLEEDSLAPKSQTLGSDLPSNRLQQPNWHVYVGGVEP